MGDQAHIDAFLAPRPMSTAAGEGDDGVGQAPAQTRYETDHAALESAEEEAARVRSLWRREFEAYKSNATLEAEKQLSAVLRRRGRIMRLAQESDPRSQRIMLGIYDKQVAIIKERLHGLLEVKQREIRERYARRALRIMRSAEHMHSRSIALDPPSDNDKEEDNDDDDSYNPGDSKDPESDDLIEGIFPSSSESDRERISGYSNSDSDSDSDSDEPVSTGHSHARGEPRRCMERRVHRN